MKEILAKLLKEMMGRSLFSGLKDNQIASFVRESSFASMMMHINPIALHVLATCLPNPVFQWAMCVGMAALLDINLTCTKSLGRAEFRKTEGLLLNYDFN